MTYYIDILFILHDTRIYDYSCDEILYFTDKSHMVDYYINIIYTKLESYERYTTSTQFDFKYIFIFTNEYFNTLANILYNLNKQYFNCVYLCCNFNYAKITGKVEILSYNTPIFFYFKFKNKTIIKNYKPHQLIIDNKQTILSLFKWLLEY